MRRPYICSKNYQGGTNRAKKQQTASLVIENKQKNSIVNITRKLKTKAKAKKKTAIINCFVISFFF